MQSTKPTFKKPFEEINNYQESTWLGNDNPVYENKICAMFKDKYPVSPGHMLFVPKKAGQSIFWPHIHMIPRVDGDSDPKKHNGIRLAHPKGDHTNYY